MSLLNKFNSFSTLSHVEVDLLLSNYRYFTLRTGIFLKNAELCFEATPENFNLNA